MACSPRSILLSPPPPSSHSRLQSSRHLAPLPVFPWIQGLITSALASTTALAVDLLFSTSPSHPMIQSRVSIASKDPITIHNKKAKLLDPVCCKIRLI